MARIDIIKSVARNLGDLIIDGVPASMTGSTVDHLELIHPQADQLRGRYFYAYSGAGAGQSRVIGSFSPANRRMCFIQGFASLPSINTNFVVTDQFAKADYDNALNRAIGVVRQRYLEDKVATLQIVGTQYEYPVPSGLAYVGNLRLVPSTGTDYALDDEVDTVQEIPVRYWNIERNAGGSYMLVFDSRMIHLETFNTEMVRVLGQAPPDITGTDNATMPEPLEEFVTAFASMHLASQKQASGEPWRTLFGLFRDEVRPRNGEGLEAYIYRYGRGRKVGS